MEEKSEEILPEKRMAEMHLDGWGSCQSAKERLWGRRENQVRLGSGPVEGCRGKWSKLRWAESN